MALRLTVLTFSLDPPPAVLIKGRKATIGRSADCDVRVPDPSVSAHHATIVRRGKDYLLRDEESSAGTGLAEGDDAPVYLTGDSPRLLQDGQHVWFGQIECRVTLEATRRGAATGYEELAPTLVRAGLVAAQLEPSAALVARTLAELSELPDETTRFETRPLPPPEPEPSYPTLTDLHQDREPAPLTTDLFVALLALFVLTGCILWLWQFTELFATQG